MLEGFEGTAGPRPPDEEAAPRVAIAVGMTKEGSELPAKLYSGTRESGGQLRRPERLTALEWGQMTRTRVCLPHLCVTRSTITVESVPASVSRHWMQERLEQVPHRTTGASRDMVLRDD